MNMVTIGDRLTRAEKARGNLDDLCADLTSILGDLECASKLLDELAGEHNDAATAYALVDKAHAIVTAWRERVEHE